MFKLYGRKNTGSSAAEALLARCGATYSVINVEKMDAAAFLKVSPRGEVPALQLPDGSVMTESAAIMIHLADCFPAAGLAPALGTSGRATYLRWMIYLSANAYNSDLRMYYPERFSTNPAHAPAINERAIQHLNRDFDIFADGLGAGPFVLGDKMTAVDIYAAMLLTWSNDVEGLLKRHPKLNALYAAVSADPVVRKVWDSHGMR